MNTDSMAKNCPSASKIFELVDFSPIGFKTINYPVPYCSICRGYLVNVCSTCKETGQELCAVVNTDNTYYHNHCYQMIKPEPAKKPVLKGKKKAKYTSSDSDSDSD